MAENNENQNMDSQPEFDAEAEMAAAMEQMMNSNEEPISDMSQDDIDRLIGKESNQPKEFKTVIDQMIYMSMLNYERLPMLDVIIDRFVLTLTTSMKTNTSANTDIDIKFIESKRYSNAMGSIPVPGILGVANATPWNGQIIVGLDAPLLYSALEIMLGGRKSKPAKPEGRNFTSIERKMASKLINVVLGDFAHAFNPLDEVKFIMDRVETNPQFATISQPNSPCVHVVLDISLEGRRGRVDIIIPYSTIDPVRKLLAKVFLGEKLGGDPTWENHLREELLESTVKLKTIFVEVPSTLHQVMTWKPGTTLELRVSEDHPATVVCGKIPMFTGRMGKKNGSVALRIEADLDGKRRMIDDINGI